VAPKVAKTVRDLIYWEYAKLIAGSAVGDRENYRFVMHQFKRLRAGQASPSKILRENRKLAEAGTACAYCGSTGAHHWDHIIPKSRGGPDTFDNQVPACPPCNLAKGAKDPFEWYGRDRTKDLPRIVLGKYLKLVFEEHERRGTLDREDVNDDGVLDIYDLGAIF
jgi:hypothetical protein